ncbi:hypothetical protein SAMN04488038_101289 [Solimonas aquatica]|uniref:Uncharacterized protein n=1 Tax=Solimonas aquatica TaxID=489703 RepID=A0A1H9A6E3_9GAMM|nr:hypothetical protein [Solimonas aquatica]SEP72214.1 hypothetical protein SAMN04488038_101289 [Solimonas aquatica]
MDTKIPFTSYDFWAYLSAGSLFLAAIDFASGTGWLLQKDWSAAQIAVAVSAAYAIGHLIAGLSSFFIERLLVGRLLGPPRKNLFGQRTWSGERLRRVLPSYYQALPPETQAAVLRSAQSHGVTQPGEALFWVAFDSARRSPPVMARLDNFLNQYGFCRNTAVVALIDAAVLFWGHHQAHGTNVHLWLSWAALLMSLGMTLRYMKFYRLYANEVFTAFAHQKP